MEPQNANKPYNDSMHSDYASILRTVKQLAIVERGAGLTPDEISDNEGIVMQLTLDFPTMLGLVYALELEFGITVEHEHLVDQGTLNHFLDSPHAITQYIIGKLHI